MRKSIQLTFSIWLVLAFIALPISFRFLPNFGSWVSAFLFPLNQWLCDVLFQIDITNTYLISDSAGFYTTAFILFIVALSISLLLYKRNQVQVKITNIIYFILVYWLSYFLLRYGFDKIIGIQFYFPAPNTLHTPLGSLSKDILFWSTMGTSSGYNYFMAATEIIAGSLLLWKRTRFLGLICSAGVLANVLATNIGFDISVKYFSALLLATCIFLLSFHFQQLRTLVGIPTTPISLPDISFSPIWKRGLKILVLLFFIFETVLYGFIYETKFPVKARSFMIEDVKGNSDILDLNTIHRLHFHREGYLITESFDQQFKSFPITPQATGFRLNNLNVAINLGNNSISWKENGKMNKLMVHEIDLGKLAISEDENHWFVEEMIVGKN